MNAELQRKLKTAIQSDASLHEIVALLRQYKEQGTTQKEVYTFLEAWHDAAPDPLTDDRILEVSDFVAGFCAPHMKIWSDEERLSRQANRNP